MKVYKGPPKEGWYIYSSCGCGDDAAIRIEYVETPNQCVCFSMDTNTAREIGRALVEISNDYDEGIVTGCGFDQ